MTMFISCECLIERNLFYLWHIKIGTERNFWKNNKVYFMYQPSVYKIKIMLKIVKNKLYSLNNFQKIDSKIELKLYLYFILKVLYSQHVKYITF